ncbi:MAG TPA: glycosyltransferase [Solirubrobacteraceae bacterium]|jgi:glycosyltransferase involved in cell wall biosynthesis
MRVLHVGPGFRPWIVHGVVIYAESIMAAQAASGHEVSYFFPGRHYPGLRGPRVRRWRRDGVAMRELVNSPLVVGRIHGTAQPDETLDHGPSEAAFARVLADVRPEVVHFHDLGGLPSSVVGIAGRSGAATVMTIHDYFPLCPTVRLHDVDQNICRRARPGDTCVRCCANAPRDNVEERLMTYWYYRKRLRHGVPGLDALLRNETAARVNTRLIEAASRIVTAGAGDEAPAPAAPEAAVAPASVAAYDRRRAVNVERLGDFDLLLPVSQRAADIYAGFGVATERMRTLTITAEHLEGLRPRRPWQPSDPVVFATLNGASSRQKGANLLVDALGALDRVGLSGRYRLKVYGRVAPDVERPLHDHPDVDVMGDYTSDQLDAILEGADVGVMPSVWEELYPIVALEFMAKGIPLVTSPLGGVTAYIREGEAGWLNQSATGEELSRIVESIVERPEQIARLAETVRSRREQLIKPMAAHVREVDDIYRELLEGGVTQPGSASGRAATAAPRG